VLPSCGVPVNYKTAALQHRNTILRYSMFFSIFIQSWNRSLDRDRFVSPEPALILAGQTLRPDPPRKRRITCEGWFAVFDHQNSPIKELASRCACVGFAADALALIDSDPYGLFFKMHL